MSGKTIDGMVAGEDDALTLADVAGVLGEIAEGFDGGEYAVSDETRRVLIDFANGLPEHPLFNIVGHYFAQHPVRITAAQQQGQAVECCPYCGGTKGHWEGCRAPVDTAPPPSVPVGVGVMDEEAALDAFDRACMNNKRVSWHGYTRDDRLQVMRRFLTALAQQPAAVECPHRTRCDCLAACKYGYAGNGATQHQEPKS